jgi:hypothetical protein
MNFFFCSVSLVVAFLLICLFQLKIILLNNMFNKINNFNIKYISAFELLRKIAIMGNNILQQPASDLATTGAYSFELQL